MPRTPCRSRGSTRPDAARTRTRPPGRRGGPARLAGRALADSNVKAPFAGLISRRWVSEGDFVAPGQKLFDVVVLDPVEVELHLTEVDSSRVAVGNPVGVSVAPYPGERFRAEISTISPTIDPATRTLRVKAVLANPDGRLRPGLFARADLGVSERKGVTMVPEEAVLQRSDGPVLFRVRDDGRVERLVVQTGVTREGRVEVAVEGRTDGRAELAEGDRVVVRGHTDLIDGAAVTVRQPALEAASAGAGGIRSVTLSELSVRRPILTWMMTLALIVFGVLGYERLGVDQFPEMDFPILTVTALFEGASPEGMEEDVTDVLEEHFNSIAGVRSIRSKSMQGVGRDHGRVPARRRPRLRDAGSARQGGPRPLRAAASDGNADRVELQSQRAARAVGASVAGAQRRRSQRVRAPAGQPADRDHPRRRGRGDLRPRRPQHPHLARRRRAARARAGFEGRARGASGANTSRCPAARQERAARVDGQDRRRVPQSSRRWRSWSSRTWTGRRSGCATSRASRTAPRTCATLAHFNGRPTVGIGIIKQSDGNTVAIVDEVMRRLEELKEADARGHLLPRREGLRRLLPRSPRVGGGDRVLLLVGAVLAVLTVFVFLRRSRPTLIIALAIPMSLVATFGVVWIFGLHAQHDDAARHDARDRRRDRRRHHRAREHRAPPRGGRATPGAPRSPARARSPSRRPPRPSRSRPCSCRSSSSKASSAASWASSG